MPSSLTDILKSFRNHAQTEREKGNYFENLCKVYFENEPAYRDLYDQVWLWESWREYWIAQGNSDPGPDTGIDLVARTRGTDEYHAIQAKFYDAGSKLYKKQIDSFFTASGKRPFTRRLLIVTTDNVSQHVDSALEGQQIASHKLTLTDLERSKIDWCSYQPETSDQTIKFKEAKSLRDYQQVAIANVIAGLASADRGKLIMACGSGKTFTALRLAEQVAGAGGRVLFLVPSLALLSQTLTEWTQESAIPIHSFAVCSDSEVGKKRGDPDDNYQMVAHELQYPATTNSQALAQEMARRHDASHLSVIFSTYHSIDVISQARQEFDLIICDEAHRTTGASFEGDDESAFVKIHNQDFIRGKKRIYMTATPRVYGVSAKAKAETDNIILYSMDNAEYFGETLHVLTFSEAVQRGILVDYKVIILTMSEDHISKNLQELLADENNSLRVDDAAKIVGCWRALSKMDTRIELSEDSSPMRRAVAFAQVIEINKGAKTHKVSSKNIADMFQKVVDAYRESLMQENPGDPDAISQLKCEARHVDGGMNAQEKEERLDWLKAESSPGICRILSNVRCLSEGVDVPALDAVLFLTPRNSQVDVVQSVGRVMRKPHDGDKKLGYVILPVVIPSGLEPHEALNDNKTYKVVWEVLQALRSHDDRFDAMINKLDLAGQDPARMEVIAITDNLKASSKTGSSSGKSSFKLADVPAPSIPRQEEITFKMGEIERAIIAKVVTKVGNRLYWDEWASDIAQIAQTHISRITAILNNAENSREIDVFSGFLKELRDDLNESITSDEAIEMLAQHIITRPVFDALFEGYSFTRNNPVSQAMQKVLEELGRHRLEKEATTLEKFYTSVKMRASGITELKARQKIIVELYDKFFRNAFPRMTERLGIVYTPVEVVDFIIHSVNDVLWDEFDQTIGDRNVHIIDPFTGTGTFITRLLQSGLISEGQLAWKYQHEIHANEIVLLAYYIAAINIEQVYHSITGGEYQPFKGICLTDTFALHEKDLLKDAMLADNSSRLQKQKNLDIRVIIGNPPYSAGQGSANDNNQNIAYPHLDGLIRDSYAAHSSMTSIKNLYDSYIRAIRWASDRIGQSGVIGFVSNAGWIDGNAMDGLRKCLAEEFSSIYVFHLRGNARTSGELRRKEKDNVFGQGSRAPIAITVLVKNPNARQQGKIVLHDIGDYLTREEKLAKIVSFQSIAGITKADAWQKITPDQHHDWIGQRDNNFADFISLGDKKNKSETTLFENYSLGINSNRDAWAYNSDKKILTNNIKNMISFYNDQLSLYQSSDAASNDETKIKWSSSLRNCFDRKKHGLFSEHKITLSVYRPFQKQWLYYDSMFNHRVGQMPRIFPDSTVENRVICVTGRGATKEFCAFMTDTLPDLEMVSKSQCFPLKLYETTNTAPRDDDLFGSLPVNDGYKIKDAITDAGMSHFSNSYPGRSISKEDLFYYIYGILHSPDYRERYADNLSKELPRIPAVRRFDDFMTFSDAGRKLAELHVGYERVEPYPATITGDDSKDFRVIKMKFADKADKSRVIYNHKITISNIPLEAWEYVVNGKAALDWVMERQSVRTDRDSGIVNDANDWAVETVGDPAYPLKLFLRVITVSLETMKIVNGLPGLDI